MGDPRPRRRAATGLRLGIAILILVLIGALVQSSRPRNTPPSSAARANPLSPLFTPYKNAAPGVAFVGDAACSRCHGEIAAAYRQHPMGHSMARGSDRAPEADGAVFEADGATYSIARRDGRIFHRESLADGKVTEAEVAYVIGSGKRGESFLVERNGVLKQSPISHYTQQGKWDLAPGYRERNRHFDRTIEAACLFCHANRFELVEGSPPTFQGLPIGCERCHGPGALHDGGAGGADGIDFTIVNPAHLAPRLRDDVCEQCHLQGSQRVEVAGRAATDYRPGLPFGAFVKTWTARANPFESRRAVGHVEEMRQSRCASASAGRLGCISCHDPHRLPDPAERVAYYRDRCLACHTDRGCALSEGIRASKGRSDDCISCHMPRVSETEISHTSQTLHNLARPAKPSQ